MNKIFTNVIPFSRQREGGSVPPDGWTIAQLTTGETVWRCPKVEIMIDGSARRCTKYYRKNAIICNHNHEYHLSREEDFGFPEDYDEMMAKHDLNQIKEKITREIALVVAQLDISAVKGSSSNMFDFVSKMLIAGKKIFTIDPNFDPRKEYIRFSTNTLSIKIIEVAKNKEEELMEYFKDNIRFINILTDAGTFNSFKVQHFIAANPNFQSVIWPVDNFENTNFKSQQYKDTIKKVIDPLHKNELEVVAIIADNQSSQTKGIIDYIKSEKGLSSAIYHIPCINHIINLIFAELIALDEFLPYIQLIDELIEYCRKPENRDEIYDTCPTLVKTRWVYLVDVLTFIKRYQKRIDILRIADGKEPIPDELIDITNILHPLQILSKKCESRSMKLSELLPAISEVTKKLIDVGNHFLSENSKTIYEFIFKTFIARMLSFPQSVLKAAYAVSLPGRTFLRNKEKGFMCKGPVSNGMNNQSYHDIKSFIEDLELVQEVNTLNNGLEEQDLVALNETVTQIAEAFYQENEELDSQNDEENIPENKDSSSLITAIEMHQNAQDYLQTTSKRYHDFNSLRNKFDHLKFDALKHIDWFTDIIECTKKEITNQALLLGYEKESEIYDMYEDWVYTPHSESIQTIKTTDTNDTYWRRVHQVSPALSHICLRFCSIGVSEAEVERLMSVQKNIFSQHATNVGTDMLHARCVIRSLE